MEIQIEFHVSRVLVGHELSKFVNYEKLTKLDRFKAKLWVSYVEISFLCSE